MLLTRGPNRSTLTFFVCFSIKAFKCTIIRSHHLNGQGKTGHSGHLAYKLRCFSISHQTTLEHSWAQLWFQIVNSCQCRPQEAAGHSISTLVPVTHLETWMNYWLLASSQNNPGHCGHLGNELESWSSLFICSHLSASQINKLKLKLKNDWLFSMW